jgi:hypothetical protein
MTFRPGLTLAAVLALTASTAFASAGPRPLPFGPGEQLDLKLEYLGITAGSARITVGADTDAKGMVWPIVGNLETKSLLAWYPIKDRMVSYWDPTVSRSPGSELYADENHKRHRQKVEFDHATRTAIVLRQKEGEPLRRSVATVEPGSMDFFAVTFALREKPLTVGAHYVFPIFTGGKTVELEAVVEGLVPLDTLFGKQPTLKVRIRTGLSGKFESKRDMFVYFTRDAHHVPVRMEADFAFGAIVAEATAYQPGKTVVLPAVATSSH